MRTQQEKVGVDIVKDILMKRVLHKSFAYAGGDFLQFRQQTLSNQSQADYHLPVSSSSNNSNNSSNSIFFLGNLGLLVTEKDVYEKLHEYGVIESVSIKRNTENQSSLG